MYIVTYVVIIVIIIVISVMKWIVSSTLCYASFVTTNVYNVIMLKCFPQSLSLCKGKLILKTF